MQEAIGTSYKMADELNKIIENDLPSRPQFSHHEVTVYGETLEFYTRDILECINSLWGDPEFTDHLILEPERQYTDEAKTNRVYHDMHTGDWWWETQVSSSSDYLASNLYQDSQYLSEES